MTHYHFATLDAGDGQVGIGPMPGRNGQYLVDLAVILAWDPQVVLTMTPTEELAWADAAGLGDDLAAAGVDWHHLPVADFGALPRDVEARWEAASDAARRALSGGGRVFAHCWGGHGRSGMALMRLMVELGEAPDHALARLRDARPGAVETEAQRHWAGQATFEGGKR